MSFNQKIGAIALVTVLLSGCGVTASSDTANTPTSKDIFAMDTVMTVTAYGSSDAVENAVAEIERLDALLSISSDTGEIAPINQNGSGKISDELAALLQKALDIGKDTDGAFDCTILPVMQLWGFTTQNYAVPNADTLAKTLSLVNYQAVQINADNVVTLPTGAGLDLGGIAKGYASDRVMQVFQADGVTSGIVSLGGNVQTLGTKPDGSLWNVAVQDPNNLEDYVGVIATSDKAIITSGGYQRYFDQDGVRYHHIIDPQTGYPAQSGLLSATIVSASGTLADGLSTAMFIMGLDKASTYWRAHKADFDAVFITNNGDVYVTAGLQDCFTMQDGSTFQVIS